MCYFSPSQRIFGFGGGAPTSSGGYYGSNGGHGGYVGNSGIGGKKILPTIGVSFGLPFPTHNYPISPNGNIPNPYFGSISPNGLNLGLLNVNPLFSLQVTKSEHGEKLVKPFVNLHVTPNENIIGKIGSLFLAKKGALHRHYHKHLHRYPPPPPHYDPHQFDPHLHPHPPPNYFDGLTLSHPPFPLAHFEEHNLPHPPHFGGHIFSNPPPFYKDTENFRGSHIEDNSFNPAILGFRSSNVSFNDQSEFPPNNEVGLKYSSFNDYSYQSLYPQNVDKFSSVKDSSRYARKFSNYNKQSSNQNVIQSIPAQAPGFAEGSEKVSFPTSRRRRDTDQVVPASIEKKEDLESVNADSNDNEGRALSAEKV